LQSLDDSDDFLRDFQKRKEGVTATRGRSGSTSSSAKKSSSFSTSSLFADDDDDSDALFK
jgi:hypothetical protein